MWQWQEIGCHWLTKCDTKLACYNQFWKLYTNIASVCDNTSGHHGISCNDYYNWNPLTVAT